MAEVVLVSMSGSGYEKYVMGTSTSIEKCQAEAPEGDFFIKESVELPILAKCPRKGTVGISSSGCCQGPVDKSGCDFNHL